MKNIMKNINILKALTGVLFVSVLVVGALSIVPVAAHAQEDDGGFDFGSDTGDGCCGSFSPDTSYSPDTYTDVSPDTYTDVSPDTYTDVSADTYSTPSYSTTGYSTGGYSTGGYSTGGYLTGGYGYTTGGGYSNSNVYAPTTVTTNTCVGTNNCNTNIQNPAPVINNVVTYGGNTNTTQYCASGYYGTYPNCYLINQQPIVYQQPPVVAYGATPYVSLSQVPYTGLDLGFWGTIAYWGAFVLFALFAAYLIAIKRVQNTIALKLKTFLFGSNESEEEAVAVTTMTLAPVKVAYSAPVQTSEDVIDSFIMSQVTRTRHA